MKEAGGIKGKALQWLLNLVLSAFFAFAVLIAAEQILLKGEPWYSYVARSWPLFFCFPLGVLGGRNRILKYILLAVSSVCVCIYISSLLPQGTVHNVIFLAAVFAMSVFIYMTGAKHNEAFPSMLTAAMILIYMAELLLLGPENSKLLDPLKICALVSFAVGLFNFNRLNLLTGVHNVKGGTSMPVPVSVGRKNVMLLIGFFAVSFLLGNLFPIGSAIIYALRTILAGIWKILMFFGGIGGESNPEPEPTPEETRTPDIVNIDAPVNKFANTFIITFIIILLVLGLIIILFAIFGGDEGLAGKLKSLKKRINRGQLDLDFEEDVEKISSLRELFKKRRRSLRGFFGRLFERQERFNDMPDNRMKVRFAYKMLLKKSGVPKAGTPLTPIEIGNNLDPESLKKLSFDYSEARYNDIEPVGDAAAENARAALSDIYKIREISENGVEG